MMLRDASCKLLHIGMFTGINWLLYRRIGPLNILCKELQMAKQCIQGWVQDFFKGYHLVNSYIIYRNYHKIILINKVNVSTYYA